MTPSLLVLFVCDIENSDVIRISVLNVMCRENHPRLKLGAIIPWGGHLRTLLIFIANMLLKRILSRKSLEHY